jgi:hypothetical protein
MYSLSTRLNSVFFFGVISLGKIQLILYYLAVLCIFNIATTAFTYNSPIVNQFEITKFTSLYNHPYTNVQHATGVANLNIDFSPCLNWNSNLVFAWITATYQTGKYNVIYKYKHIHYSLLLK